MNNLLLFMCMMGSLMYLFYLLLHRLLTYRLNPSLRLYMLAAAGLFYTAPIPLLIQKYKTLIPYPVQRVLLPDRMRWGPSKIIPVTEEGVYRLPTYPVVFWALCGVWLTVLLFLFVRSIRKFRMTRKFWFQISRSTDQPYPYRSFLGFRRVVQVRTFRAEHTPFMMGYFRSVIFIQEGETGRLGQILSHELHHVRYLHNFIKLWGFLIFALHWYCPLSLLYFLSLSHTLELLCDARVLKNASEAERADYARLLLGIPTPAAAILPCAHLSAFKGPQFYFMKERLSMIKHARPRFSAAALLAAILFTFISAAPAAAYHLPRIAEMSEQEVVDSIEIFEVEEGVELWELFPEDFEKLHFDVSDTYFMAEDGEIYFDLPKERAYVRCGHDLQSGIFYSHFSGGKGDCTYKKYNARRCTKCGHTKIRSLICTGWYAECTH